MHCSLSNTMSHFALVSEIMKFKLIKNDSDILCLDQCNKFPDSLDSSADCHWHSLCEPGKSFKLSMFLFSICKMG